MIQILLFALLLGLALLIMSVPPADGAGPDRVVPPADGAGPDRVGPPADGAGSDRVGRLPGLSSGDRVRAGARVRKGLALAAAAIVLGGTAWGAWQWAGVSPGIGAPVRVVVMPFATAGPQEPYVALALTEELATRLAREEISVASLSAVRALVVGGRSHDVAAELDADYLIEGSVSVDGSGAEAQLLVRVRLVEAGTSAQVWSQVYDEPAQRIFEVERQIAERVARAIDVPLTSPAGVGLSDATTENYAAYEAYLEGLSHRRRVRDPAHALEARIHFARARDLDPDFAPSSAALATVYAWLAVLHDFAVPMDSVYLLRDEALELAPNDTDAVMAAALVQWALDSEDRAAIERYEQLQPHLDPLRHAIAQGFLRDLFWRQGDKETALDWGWTALETDPYMATLWVGQARLLMRVGRVDQGLALLDRGSTGEWDSWTDRLRMLAPLLTNGDTAASWSAHGRMDGSAGMSPLLFGLRPDGRALARVFADRLVIADLPLPGESASDAARAGARLVRGLLLADRGDEPAAVPELQEALEAFDQLLVRPEILALYTRVRVAIGRALALAGLGRPDEARAALIDAEGRLLDRRDDLLREEFLLGRAETLARIGDVGLARLAWEEALGLPALISPALAAVDPLWSRVVSP